MSHLKKCLACGQYPGGNRVYCQRPDCQRAAGAARQARYRARRASMEQVPESVPIREATGLLETPWGVTYPNEAEAWASVLLSEGLPDAERSARQDALGNLLNGNPRAIEGDAA